MSYLWYRAWFCAALAIIAAGLANPCVEFASNAGWLGRGDFTDHSNVDVIPTLGVGIVFAALVIMRRISQLAFTARAQRFAAWLRLSNHVLRARSVAPFMPAALGMQMLVLFSMESVEQVVVHGHVVGGMLWLGGPVIASLAIHAVVCVATAYVLTKALHGFARTAVRIARLIHIALLSVGSSTTILPRIAHTSQVRQAPLHCGIGERAPPSPSY
jgi:hypothetical protein